LLLFVALENIGKAAGIYTPAAIYALCLILDGIANYSFYRGIIDYCFKFSLNIGYSLSI
jgi:hypothetical protein